MALGRPLPARHPRRACEPRGCLLQVQPALDSDREGSCVLMLEPLWRDDVAVIVSLPLGAVAALNGELA
jgi:hypothetical protein